MIKYLRSLVPIFIVLLILFNSIPIAAQEIGVKVDFFGYADNREFKAKYTQDKTYFGTITTPQIAFKLYNKHQLIGGLHYQYDFGKNADNKNELYPVMYYNYRTKHLDFSIGNIPRYERLHDSPRFILADTFQYERPNIEGMYLSLGGPTANQHIYLDWLNKQSKSYREQFIVGTAGRYKWGAFLLQNDVIMYHNALTTNDAIEENIQDNMTASLRLGIDLGTKIGLDSIQIMGGIIGNYDRIRTKYEDYNFGFINEIKMAYKTFFLRNLFYIGDEVTSPLADPFFRNKQYDRLDIGWRPFHKGNIEGVLTASFHFAQNMMSNQHIFTLRYNFDQTVFTKK